MTALHIERLGAGPPLVLVHGWAMHAGIFAPLCQALAVRHTLHLVDLPGHGHSRGCRLALDPAACADAIAADVPENAAWLGWSLGGLVTLQAAARCHTDAAILVAASPRFVAGADWPHGVDPDVFAQFGDGLARDYRATVDRFLALEAQGSDHMREELRLLREQVYARGEPDARVLAEGLGVLESTDLRARLPGLAARTLWIAGRRDRLITWQAMQAAATLSGGRFVRIDGGGHAPFLTHANAVAGAVIDFLDGVAA